LFSGTLVLLGQEARGRHAHQAADAEPECNDEHHPEHREADTLADDQSIKAKERSGLERSLSRPPRTPSIPRLIRPMRPRRGPGCRKNTAHKAGESVSALNAEISTAAMIVTAILLEQHSGDPGDEPDRDEDRIGAVSCAIAFLAAAAGESSGSSSMTRYDAVEFADDPEAGELETASCAAVRTTFVGSTAARVAFSASSTRSFFSFTSTPPI
jgi:hypothetical protein